MSEPRTLADLNLPEDVRDRILDEWMRHVSDQIMEFLNRHVDTEARLAEVIAEVEARKSRA